MTPGIPYATALSASSVIAITRSRAVYSAYSLFSHMKITGRWSAQAMFAASWKAPILVDPSLKNAIVTRLFFRYLFANAAPTACGTPAPTMPFAPSIPRSRSEICIAPPFPLQYPVDRPINSAIMGLNWPPLATRWPCPRCVEVIWSSSLSATHPPTATASSPT